MKEQTFSQVMQQKFDWQYYLAAYFWSSKMII